MKITRAWQQIACVLLLAALIPWGAQAAINTKSGKYAAYVVDADTGEVFYDRHSSRKRYPASLTKMMTLYLLFEALKNGQFKLDTLLPVSARAASQPQTNISLRKGQTIPVKDAIKALIVRSANDVAVVVAEALGKSEWNFALKMTDKARSLGMSKTQFRNAHGLPDREQYTTARDMAKLSIALRRDFPQYYHYFKTKKFSWKGRSYTGHNRVLDRFDGVDGIKTGYINMSGFNLASSVKRDGYHVVAIVMGGQTSRARDAHMVSLLEKTYTKLAERADQPRDFAQAPVPKAKPEEIQTASVGLPWIRISFNDDNKKEESATGGSEKAQAKQSQDEVKIAQAQSQASDTLFRFVSDPDKSQLERANTLNFQLDKIDNGTQPAQGKWGIQVGAFRDESAALKAASKAVEIARNELKFSKIKITDHGQERTSIHRARLANLTKNQARRACQTLSRLSQPCFVFRADQQNL